MIDTLLSARRSFNGEAKDTFESTYRLVVNHKPKKRALLRWLLAMIWLSKYDGVGWNAKREMTTECYSSRRKGKEEEMEKK